MTLIERSVQSESNLAGASAIEYSPPAPPSRVLHIDFETRSALDLPTVGVYRYAEDPSTDILCVCWALDEGPVQTWLPGDAVPDDLGIHVIMNGAIVAHNKDFERIIWREILANRYDWPEPDLEQWECTMAMAGLQAVPLDLENAAWVMGLQEQKDVEGARLMRDMCKPKKILMPGDAGYEEARSHLRAEPQRRDLTHLLDGRIIVWPFAKEKQQRLTQYCAQDVRTERSLHGRLRPMPDSERNFFLLDAKINDRGLLVDYKTIENAQKIVDTTLSGLKDEMAEITGRLCSPTSPASIVKWLNNNGHPEVTSVAKESVLELLKRDDLTPTARRVLEIRQEAGKSSTAKLRAFTKYACSDGRCRGNFVYARAHTGRWAGRGVQLQNLVRPTGAIEIPLALELLKNGDEARLIDLTVGPPLDVVAECMRGMIIAAPGKDFIACDFANIEGRVSAWLAGETWKLDAFRAQDLGEGFGIYELAAANIYHVPPEEITKSDPRRQIGKVAELSLGYGGSIGAFRNMAKNYNVIVAPREADQIKTGWRSAHPMIAQSWRDIEAAAFNAVRYPDQTFWFCNDRLAFRVHRDFLWMWLPSGRALAYCRPHIADNNRKVEIYNPETDALEELETVKAAVHFWATDGSTKWTRQAAYGGKWWENAVQAISRDILAEAMLRLENAGYPIVLHAHDEAVAEVPELFGSLDEFKKLMEVRPRWASDCPIVAEGWRGKRYRK
jgi:DNA polymerase